MTNDTTKSTPVARRLANGRRRWSCAGEVEAQRGGRGRGGKLAVPLEKLRCLGCLGGVGVAVRGDVPVRCRRQAAGMRSQRLGTQEMGGSRCRNATRVLIQLDQGPLLSLLLGLP